VESQPPPARLIGVRMAAIYGRQPSLPPPESNAQFRLAPPLVEHNPASCYSADQTSRASIIAETHAAGRRAQWWPVMFLRRHRQDLVTSTLTWFQCAI
jgi:hypothetical protein